MKIVLVGLSPRDETVFDLFLKRFMVDWRWQGLPAKQGEKLPSADVLVIDLAAYGWAQHSERSLGQLTHAAVAAVAILLVSANDTSWAGAKAAYTDQKWVWLRKPYNADLMRGALTEAVSLVKAQKKRAAPAAPRAVAVPAGATIAPKPAASIAPGSPVSVGPSTTVADSARAAELPKQAVPDHDATWASAGHDFGVDELIDCLARLPADRFVLLRKLSSGLQKHLPFEVRFTMQHCLIVHPADGWVANNTPMQVVMRVCRSDALAAPVSLRELGLTQAEDRVHQLGMTAHDLGDFMRELAAASFPAAQFLPHVSS
ncbi:MAG TPA: hypothetical protein PLB25_02350 [Rhodoferax sp.]|nr:hypothetical protein [Rhodoferax sp.]